MASFMTKTPDGVWIRLTDMPSALSPEDLANVLDSESLIIEWLKTARAYAENAVRENKIQIPGWTFQPGRRSFEWRDEASAVAAMTAAGINDPYKRELHSPAQAKKMVPEDRHSILEAMIETKPGKPVLKRGGTHAAPPTPAPAAYTPSEFGF